MSLVENVKRAFRENFGSGDYDPEEVATEERPARGDKIRIRRRRERVANNNTVSLAPEIRYITKDPETGEDVYHTHDDFIQSQKDAGGELVYRIALCAFNTNGKVDHEVESTAAITYLRAEGKSELADKIKTTNLPTNPQQSETTPAPVNQTPAPAENSLPDFKRDVAIGTLKMEWLRNAPALTKEQKTANERARTVGAPLPYGMPDFNGMSDTELVALINGAGFEACRGVNVRQIMADGQPATLPVPSDQSTAPLAQSDQSAALTPAKSGTTGLPKKNCWYNQDIGRIFNKKGGAIIVDFIVNDNDTVLEVAPDGIYELIIENYDEFKQACNQTNQQQPQQPAPQSPFYGYGQPPAAPTFALSQGDYDAIAAALANNREFRRLVKPKSGGSSGGRTGGSSGRGPGSSGSSDSSSSSSSNSNAAP